MPTLIPSPSPSLTLTLTRYFDATCGATTGLRFEPLVGTHEVTTQAAAAAQRGGDAGGGGGGGGGGGAATTFMFMGSSLGNYFDGEIVGLLQLILGAMGPRDRLLLGVDRCHGPRKPPRVIHEAYNDAAGYGPYPSPNPIQNQSQSQNQIPSPRPHPNPRPRPGPQPNLPPPLSPTRYTAAFTLNALSHANRVAGVDFDESQWRHEAVYEEARRTVLHCSTQYPEYEY